MPHLTFIKKPLTLSLTILSVLMVLLSTFAPAFAQQGVPQACSSPASAAQGPTDPAELEAFLDEYFTSAMQEYHVAGAVVAVVKDGQLFFSKGYGYSDLAEGVLVDPQTTMFRIGSNTKTFTWTAVMQLAEQGRVDLDADINTYLDFRVPDTFPQPITLKHLMTHTSGFGERWLESLVEDESEILSEPEWLSSNMPARLFAPGTSVAYSNYNAMLAGYIVSRVSGMTYAQYIQENILEPLGMAHSTAEWPAPSALQPYLSNGYEFVDGQTRVFPNFIGQPAAFGSGSIQASANDMARFMIAHLEDGSYSDESLKEGRILQPETIQQMRQVPFPIDPRLGGMTYAFADMSENGVHVLGHQGYTPPMNSLTLLLPDQHLGIFFAFNTQGTDALTTQHIGFERAFFDHYFPAPPNGALLAAPEGFDARAERYSGSYRRSSYPASTPDKVADLFGAFTYTVSAPGDGTLLVEMEGFKLNFVEVEPLYFKTTDGLYSLVFFEEDGGRITGFYTDYAPQYAASKKQWFDLTSFHLPLMAVSLLLLISSLVVSPVQALVNRRRGAHPGPAARIARWILAIIALLDIGFLAGMMLGYHPLTVLHGVAPFIKLLFALTLVSALLTAVSLVTTVRAWKERAWGLASGLYFTLVTVAAVAFIWFLNYWNLLGLRF